MGHRYTSERRRCNLRARFEPRFRVVCGRRASANGMSPRPAYLIFFVSGLVRGLVQGVGAASVQLFGSPEAGSKLTESL
jgi:hypothetical protein